MHLWPQCASACAPVPMRRTSLGPNRGLGVLGNTGGAFMLLATTKHPPPPHAETQRPLPADALLLDEASMMDLPLAAALFNAIECAVGWEAMRSRAHTPAQVCPAWGSPSRIVLV